MIIKSNYVLKDAVSHIVDPELPCLGLDVLATKFIKILCTATAELYYSQMRMHGNYKNLFNVDLALFGAYSHYFHRLVFHLKPTYYSIDKIDPNLQINLASLLDFEVTTHKQLMDITYNSDESRLITNKFFENNPKIVYSYLKFCRMPNFNRIYDLNKGLINYRTQTLKEAKFILNSKNLITVL